MLSSISAAIRGSRPYGFFAHYGRQLADSRLSNFACSILKKGQTLASPVTSRLPAFTGRNVVIGAAAAAVITALYFAVKEYNDQNGKKAP